MTRESDPLAGSKMEGAQSALYANAPVDGTHRAMLEGLESQIVPDVTIDDTIRVKVLDRCGMTCTFCHNEGTPVTSTLGTQGLRVSVYSETNGIPFNVADITAGNTDRFQESLAALKDGGVSSELHWTGGEPTLSRDLPDLTRAAREVGYEVKMTSNGQSGDRRLKELAAAGLTGVNFSIFGTTPEELASTQSAATRNPLRIAAQKLKSMDKAMHAAPRAGLKVKANVVISGAEDIERGLRLLDNAPEEVKVRFQADTSRREESTAAIYDLMRLLEAKPVARELVAGCSIDNYDYELPSGRVTTFKQTRLSRLPESCNGCAVDAAGQCHEGYYGLRLYRDTEDDYWVSGCIQRMDISQELGAFLSVGGLADEVKQYREQDKSAIMNSL